MDRFRSELLAERADTIKAAGLAGEVDKLTAEMDACKAGIPSGP